MGVFFFFLILLHLSFILFLCVFFFLLMLNFNLLPNMVVPLWVFFFFLEVRMLDPVIVI
jgi:hypothetical protein